MDDGRAQEYAGGAFRDPLAKVRAHDIAIMLLSGVRTRAEIARALACSPQNVDNIMRTDEFKSVLDELVKKHTDDKLNCILDERADVLVRRASLEAKTLTLAGKVINKLNGMLDQPGEQRLGVMRAGIEAAARIDKMSPHAIQRHDRTVRHVHTFNPTKAQADIIKQARDESGIGMADVMDVTPVDDSAATG